MTFYKRRISAHLELNTQCNAMCSMCYDRNYIDDSLELKSRELLPSHYLSENDINRIFDDDFLASFSLKKIIFCGTRSEPSLNPDLFEIIRLLAQKIPSLCIYISTNGATHTPSWWSSLAQNLQLYSKHHQVVFCIDGLEDTHSIYRINTSYQDIIHRAQAFIQSGGRASWQFLVFQHNQHQINAARGLAKDYGFEDFVLKYTNYFKKNNLEQLKFAYKGKKYLISPSDTGKGDGDSAVIPTGQDCIKCYARQDNSFYIDAFANVYPCSFLSTAILGGHPSGMHDPADSDLWPITSQVNALQRSLKDILLDSPAWAKLAARWANKSTSPLVCTKMCGSQDSHMCDFARDENERITQQELF